MVFEQTKNTFGLLKPVKSLISLFEQQLWLNDYEICQFLGFKDFSPEVVDLISCLYQQFNESLNKRLFVTFDRLISYALDIAKSEPTCNDFGFKYLAVDEFQDVNPIQYELIKNLLKKHTNVTVVGDPKQSIYRFRGADPGIFDEFVKDFNARKIEFLMNFRCHEDITRAIKSYDDKVDPIEPLSVVIKVPVKRKKVDYDLVCDLIQRLKNESVNDYGEIAVLAHSVSGELKGFLNELKARQIPFITAGDHSLMGDEAVKAFIAATYKFYSDENRPRLTKVVENYLNKAEEVLTQDKFSLLNDLIFKELSPSGVMPFEKFLDKVMAIDPFAEAILDPSSMPGWYRFHKLITSYLTYFNVRQDLFYNEFFRRLLPSLLAENLDLFDIDDELLPIDRVFVSTVHQAKGLEFPVVFFIAAKTRSPDAVKRLTDDITNLIRVGISRASQLLFLVEKPTYDDSLNYLFERAAKVTNDTRFDNIGKSILRHKLGVAKASNLVSSYRCLRKYSAIEGLGLTTKPTTETIKGEIFHAALGEICVLLNKSGVIPEKSEIREIVNSCIKLHRSAKRLRAVSINNIVTRVQTALIAVKKLIGGSTVLLYPELEYCISSDFLGFSEIKGLCYVRPDLIFERNSTLCVVEFKSSKPKNQDALSQYEIQVKTASYIISKLKNREDIGLSYLIFGDCEDPFEVNDVDVKQVVESIENTWQLSVSDCFKRPKSIPVKKNNHECYDCPIRPSCHAHFQYWQGDEHFKLYDFKYKAS